MPAIRALPEHPHSEHLKNQAKNLLKSVKAREPDALQRVWDYFTDPDSLGLQQSQLIIAREYGFSSWQKLMRHVESVPDANPDASELSIDQLTNIFLNKSVLVYGQDEAPDPQRFKDAATRSLANSLTTTDPGLLADLITKMPGLLHDVASNNKLTTMSLLLDLGADPNPIADTTPLHQAAWKGHQDMIELLIRHGADASIRDHTQFLPPIAWADYGGHETLALWMENHAMDGFTAAARGNVDALTQLLTTDTNLINKRFTDVRPCPEKGSAIDWMTPLVFAVLKNNLQTTRLLLQYGADPQIADQKESHSTKTDSLLELARKHASTDVTSLLVEFGARQD